MRVLLVSTYELGHQPLHVAGPAGALRRAGHDVRALDLAVQPWDDDLVRWADVVAFAVPMHTAMRLAVRAAARVRATAPSTPIWFYGLYAPVSRDLTAGRLADRLVAGEFEDVLVRWANAAADGDRADGDRADGDTEPLIQLGRARAALPARDLLPSLDRYARLAVGDEARLVGYVEASHGCSHRCKHCPVPTVYDGRVRTVAGDVVLDDVAQLVELGAQHITFGDPDFLNAVSHSTRVVEGLHARFPDVTFDCTVKVEHILRHADVWARWRDAGCLFVVSAVESVNDAILERLDKGHTAADAGAAVGVLRSSGIELRPSLLPFTPWTTVADMVDLLHFVVEHDLIANVDPVQYTIRLLLPEGSLLLDRDDVRNAVGPYDPELLTYPWTSADPAVDRLQRELADLVERSVTAGDPIEATFLDVNAAVHRAAGLRPPADVIPAGSTQGRPRLTEPWFC
jgi:radical SAM superfamily enzyme YgiQ (UPF0313 family)